MLSDRLYEAKVGFQNFANVHNDENFGYCTCLCGICNKAFVTKFCVSPSTSFSGILDLS
jgi:hypothetical protein